MATEQIPTSTPDVKSVQDAIDSAIGRIAPSWPLDQWIAVNPYWGFTSSSVQAAASQIERCSGSRMLMPRSFYRDQWKADTLREEHLIEALKRSGSKLRMEELLSAMEKDEAPSVSRIPLATRIADLHRDLLHGMSLTDFVTHSISQHCASCFDHFQSLWETQHKTDLYQSWLQMACNDKTPRLLMGIHGLERHAALLPQEAAALINQALHTLAIPEEQWESYLTALLMNINGWASVCAYQRWQARLSQRTDDHIIQLLAIRLAWDHFTFLHLLSADARIAWQHAWTHVNSPRDDRSHQNAIDWVFQEALEVAYQQELCGSLQTTSSGKADAISAAATVQAVFCIDVRSEVFRRALEACTPQVQTLGFAGFFGLPIAYTPLGASTSRPQLPGLLAPSLAVFETTGSAKTDAEMASATERSLAQAAVWKAFRAAAVSMFTFVEACGLFFAGALLRKTVLALNIVPKKHGSASKTRPSLSPLLPANQQLDSSSAEELCDLVARILTNMGLTKGFARILLLVGHGSESTNNPHAAGLECGACGGHSGEVNARVLAGLLNDDNIRAALLKRGLEIPAQTHVLAALHNTTTDEVTLFDAQLTPESHSGDRRKLEQWLKQAGHRARCERARSIGMSDSATETGESLLRQFQMRSKDWSQVRPEWGLVNNAAFLIAPRSRSYGRNLHGRVFLHEYQSALDPDGTVLEAIMTAPMLVTNWINMQYYASTVDNRLYGCGNKVLHNVVGGRLGVFEGNGGDLRIGLPLQSLHDGRKLRHIPLRLSVFIEAPQRAIENVIFRHEVVRNLIENGWIHLFQITPESTSIARYRSGAWTPTQPMGQASTEPATRLTEEAYA